jgi:hypothetical protein
MRKTASITGAGSDVVMAPALYGCEAALAALRQVAEAPGGGLSAARPSVPA